jgi:hypothetical protein
VDGEVEVQVWEALVAADLVGLVVAAVDAVAGGADQMGDVGVGDVGAGEQSDGEVVADGSISLQRAAQRGGAGAVVGGGTGRGS